MRRYALIVALAALMIGCTTSDPKSSPASNLAAKQPVVYQPPAAKNEIAFDEKCGAATPSIATVPPEEQKYVIAPRPDPRRPLSSPIYPAHSLESRQEGAPELSVLVTETGAVERVKLKQTSGYVELDNAALESVRNWRFVPARAHDTPVCMWVIMRQTFKVNDAKGK